MKTAWYVDDDQEMIQAITLLMKLLDYRVRPFLNAQDAAAAIMEDQPELLILDINMPNVSGTELLTFLRSHPQYDHLPILMLSTEHTDLIVDDNLKLGADAFVMKPVTLEELESAIEQAYRKRGLIP